MGMKKPTPLIYRLTMKDYGEVPLGALDAMNDAAKRIEELVKANVKLVCQQDSIREAALREAATQCKTCQCRDEILALIGEKK